jgi:hypothetical protein
MDFHPPIGVALEEGLPRGNPSRSTHFIPDHPDISDTPAEQRSTDQQYRRLDVRPKRYAPFRRTSFRLAHRIQMASHPQHHPSHQSKLHRLKPVVSTQSGGTSSGSNSCIHSLSSRTQLDSQRRLTSVFMPYQLDTSIRSNSVSRCTHLALTSRDGSVFWFYILDIDSSTKNGTVFRGISI